MAWSRFGLGIPVAAAALALAACTGSAPAVGHGEGGAAGNSAGHGGSAGFAGPGTAGQGVAGSSGGAAGTAGSAGTTGAAGVAGAAGAGGLGGTGVAGGGGAAVGPGVLEPRVLVNDRASNRLFAYDRYGQIVHDYTSQLAFGNGFSSPTVGYTLGPLPEGLDQRTTYFFISAGSMPAGTTKLRIVGMDGRLAMERSFAGTWDGFDVSPTGRYFHAIRWVSDPDAVVGAVIRVSDSHVVWQSGGRIAQTMFTPDDHFLYVPFDRATPVRVVDLTTETDIAPALAQPVFTTQPGVWVTLVTSTGTRAVIQTDGLNMFGRLLWSMDWQGRISRFGAEMPAYIDESFLGFDPTGTKALWQRQTNGNDGQPIVHVGVYQIDFDTGLVGPFSGSTDCFESPSLVLFKYESGAVQDCPCGSACTTIATLPALESAWVPTLRRAGNVLLITYGWARNGTPRVYPDVTVLSTSGAVIASLPYGVASMDGTGQILLYRQAVGTTLGPPGIVDLATGNIAWISAAPDLAFVYE